MRPDPRRNLVDLVVHVPLKLTGMSQRIRRSKRRKAGRHPTSPEKREHRLTVALTTLEMKKLDAEVKKIGLPRYLLVRWRVTDHPIPRPPIKKRR